MRLGLQIEVVQYSVAHPFFACLQVLGSKRYRGYFTRKKKVLLFFSTSCCIRVVDNVLVLKFDSPSAHEFGKIRFGDSRQILETLSEADNGLFAWICRIS